MLHRVLAVSTVLGVLGDDTTTEVQDALNVDDALFEPPQPEHLVAEACARGMVQHAL